MKMFLSFLVLTLSAVCYADQPPSSYNPEPSYAPMNYEFSWRVQDDYSKNNYGQDEKSDSGRTSGSYYVALPDGRLQKVTYSVYGNEGYKAEVTYEGEASYPQAAASSYKPVKVAAPASYQPAPPAQPTYKKAEPTAAPYQPPAPAPEPSYKPGEVYYKPVDNAPEPEVYYKPVPSARR